MNRLPGYNGATLRSPLLRRDVDYGHHQQYIDLRSAGRSYSILTKTPVIFNSIDWAATWSDFQHVATAYLLTAVIGWNREQEEHAAGLRTFPIVGMASCGYILILGSHADSAAQSRVLQGLITGIGFVGGGAIIKEGANVRGTATAASVWNAGVIGASVALDHYGIALVLTLLNLFTLRSLLPLKKRLDKT